MSIEGKTKKDKWRIIVGNKMNNLCTDKKIFFTFAGNRKSMSNICIMTIRCNILMEVPSMPLTPLDIHNKEFIKDFEVMMKMR